MGSEMQVRKIWPRGYTSAYIELEDGEVVVFPKLVVDSIESLSSDTVNIEGWDASTYVLTEGNQEINGIKTFTQIPVLPDLNPSTDNQAARKKYVDDLVGALSIFPVGGILPYAGNPNGDNNPPIPEGFLLCDGRSYSKTERAALFAVIKYTYGGGGDLFFVPDLKGRVIVGLYNPLIIGPNTYHVFDDIGQTNNIADIEHVLSVPEMPAHNHTYIHTPVYGRLYGANQTEYAQDRNIIENTSTTGSSDAHNNLQPYIVMNYIIKC